MKLFARQASLPDRRGAAFLFGVAHVLDLGAVFARRRGRFGQGFRGDAAAMRRDWRIALDEVAFATPAQPRSSHGKA